jgi:hypothetical protein
MKVIESKPNDHVFILLKIYNYYLSNSVILNKKTLMMIMVD